MPIHNLFYHLRNLVYGHLHIQHRILFGGTFRKAIQQPAEVLYFWNFYLRFYCKEEHRKNKKLQNLRKIQA